MPKDDEFYPPEVEDTLDDELYEDYDDDPDDVEPDIDDPSMEQERAARFGGGVSQ
jgi:hypothetical protein